LIGEERLMFKLLLALGCLLSSLKAAEPRVVGYFVEWGVYDRNFHVRDIPAGKLTHLNYAFAKIVDGEVAVFDTFAALEKAYPEGKIGGTFHQLQLLKKQHPQLKTLISVGGWTLSSPFSDLAMTDAGRKKFVASAVRFIRKHHFDGVDIDWEYPVGGGKEGNKNRPEDRANYTLLLAELRTQLDAAGKADTANYLLSIAGPAGPRTIEHFDLAGIAKHVDWINVMAYDFHGGWDQTTHFNAPLSQVRNDPVDDALSKRLNVASATETYLKAGVPAEKIVLGVPFFGRGWSGVKDANNGLFQPRTGIPKGTWEDGVFDYKDIEAKYLKTMTRHWNDDAKVPWLFNPKTGLFITYDDPESIKLKAEFARDKKLGGVMIWELSEDDRRGSLLEAARAGLLR